MKISEVGRFNIIYTPNFSSRLDETKIIGRVYNFGFKTS